MTLLSTRACWMSWGAERLVLLCPCAHNHALYKTLGATRRSRIHREVARALETAYGDDTSPRIEELARHWIAAAPSQLAKAQLYSKRAGERALAKLAPDEAVGWFEQVRHLLEATPEGDRTERCEVRILLGEAQRQAGRPEYRATLLSAARMAEEMQDAERMARAALANSRGFASTFGVVDHERIAVLQRAVELDRFAHPARCAQLLSLQAMERSSTLTTFNDARWPMRRSPWRVRPVMIAGSRSSCVTTSMPPGPWTRSTSAAIRLRRWRGWRT